MGVDVKTEVTIAAPLNRVAAYASEPSNATEWYVNIVSVDWLTPKPVRVGSQMDFVAKFLGRTLRYTYEVVEVTRDARFVMRTAQGPFAMETIYEWRANPDGSTKMTLRNRGEPRGFSRFAAPFMGRAMRRANRKDLARLKSILERE